jgi:hypothetical protein
VDRIVGLSGALATNPLKLKDLPAQLGGKPTVELGRKRAADRLWSVYSGPIPQTFIDLHSESRRKPCVSNSNLRYAVTNTFSMERN